MGNLRKPRTLRYASYKTGIGAEITAGKIDLKKLEEYALKSTKLKNESDRLETLKARLNNHIF